MGNCQAIDVVAAAIIQHPNGSLKKLYWPTTAGEVMRSYPGHHVALVSFHISGDVLNTSNTKGDAGGGGGGDTSSLRLICVRLLKHNDLLLIGQVYRLVTSQGRLSFSLINIWLMVLKNLMFPCFYGSPEVAKALQARKQERHMKAKAQAELMKQQQHKQRRPQSAGFEGRDQVVKNEKERSRISHQWRPSLQSISEAGIE
ncbi:hypothetical protein IEQ34_011668 [Dendrobium chrysotoxum]|uniref:Uncharacterized protein n=1 Tax=Dendrobium chrysotoxum TaxID=161865 RepID=A0AAV7GTI5_DENCH|nr:hypothetical protein IEQ34_011668 [Dendrobium chrysotoxum]